MTERDLERRKVTTERLQKLQAEIEELRHSKAEEVQQLHKELHAQKEKLIHTRSVSKWEDMQVLSHTLHV